MAALRSGEGLDRFSGLMDQQSASLSGLWATLKDTGSQGLAEALEPFVPTLKIALDRIGGESGGLFDRLADGAEDLARHGPRVINTITRGLREAKPFFEDVWTGIKDIGSAITDGFGRSGASMDDFREGFEGISAALDPDGDFMYGVREMSRSLGTAIGLGVRLTGALSPVVGILAEFGGRLFRDTEAFIERVAVKIFLLGDSIRDLRDSFSFGGVTRVGSSFLGLGGSMVGYDDGTLSGTARARAAGSPGRASVPAPRAANPFAQATRARVTGPASITGALEGAFQFENHVYLDGQETTRSMVKTVRRENNRRR